MPRMPESPRQTTGRNVTVSPSDILAILRGEHSDPFAVLGPHRLSGKALAVRAFLPFAEEARVIPRAGASRPQPMERVHAAGVFEALFPTASEPFAYRLETVDSHGRHLEFDDPYRFPPTLSDYDLHLLGEGTHYKAYEKLGAHLRVMDGVAGVAFTVWAPNARRVSVVGDFNQWDGRCHPMRCHPGNGIWDIFIPGLAEGDRYKFEILSRSGELLALKADPYAFAFELETPRTASVVCTLEGYEWGMRTGSRSGSGGIVSTAPLPSTRCTWGRGCVCPRRATAS